MQINQLYNAPIYGNISAPKVISECQNKGIMNSCALNDNPVAHLNMASIAFGAMKKSQFSGIDLIMVNKLTQTAGLNIQKLNTNEEFQNFCQNILDKKYLGEENIAKMSQAKDIQAEEQKKKILTNWTNYINENNTFNPAAKLFIFSSVTKNLDNSTNHLPPVLDKGKVTDTMQEITEKLKTDKNYNPSFDKVYETNLQKSAIQAESLDKGLNGWIIIPSRKKDSKNFEKNIEKLQILSHNNWCTKNDYARQYLSEGDFHIYMENGQPKLGVRYENYYVHEIQGEKNNTVIPLKYFDILKEHIKNDYTDSYTNVQLYNAEETKNRIKNIKSKHGDDVFDNKKYDKILPELGFGVEKDEKNMLTLSHFAEPAEYTFEDLGIDENDLFKHIKKIKGDADFKGSEVSNLSNLQSIEGNASFYESNVQSLGNLQNINGNADFRKSHVTSLNNLQVIGKNAECFGSKISSLGDLKSIGGNADFRMSKLKSLDNLQTIGGNALLNATEITSLGDLRSIGGDAEFFGIKTVSLDKLQSIGGNANFCQSKILSLGDLKAVGGKINISGSLLKEEDFANIAHAVIISQGNL